MNPGQSTKIKFSITYEIEIDVSSSEELEIDMKEIISHYLPQQRDLSESVKSLVNAKDLPLTLSLEANEEAAIERALTESKGSVAIAAQLLGITRATVYSKMRKYGIKNRIDTNSTSRS